MLLVVGGAGLEPAASPPLVVSDDPEDLLGTA